MTKEQFKRLEARAVRIARAAHEGQRDRDGSWHIDHVYAVAAPLSGRERLAALLHDVLEDAPDRYTAASLKAHAGFPDEVIDAVELLTRDGAEPYADYVLRIKLAGGVAGRIARAVKRSDAAHNLARSRRANESSAAARYERVLAELGA